MEQTARGGLVLTLLDSGTGLKAWAQENGKGIASTYDRVLRELASKPSIRARVLEKAGHSATRVYGYTGDADFDHFVGTALAMQTIVRGLGDKYAIDQLSMELLDPLLELRQSHQVTRAWLSMLMSHKYKSDRRIHRFGELARISLLTASLLGFHDNDPIFVWAVENREGIEEATIQQWTRCMRIVFESEGYPQFDLWVVKYHGRALMRRIDIDTGSIFCRRLLRNSTEGMESYSDTQYLNCPFFNEFTESLGFTPSRLEDFTVECFTRQVHWFKDKPGTHGCTYRFLHRFYRHVAAQLPDSQNQFPFETDLPSQILEAKESPLNA